MKKYLILGLAVILVLLGGGVFAYSSWQNQKEVKLLSGNPQTKEAYAKVLQRQNDIKKDKNNYDAYMSLAFSWKGIGEVMKSDVYLQRAVDAYDKVIKRWGMKAYLPFLNRANVLIALKEYEKAEADLKIASEIDPGEQNLYVALADLYSDYMKKSDKEIRAVYENGLTRVVGGGGLVLNYASYLNSAGDYKEALKYYKMLAQAYPNNTGYAELVKEMEGKIR
jgi:tetratricopeptide (TPR) repeat protein